MFKKKKKKPQKNAPPPPRFDKCAWCEKPVNLNGMFTCDGAGETLHIECFNKRWELLKNEG